MRGLSCAAIASAFSSVPPASGYCESSGTRGRTVTLKVKFANLRQITRSRTGQMQIRTRSERAVLEDVVDNGIRPEVRFAPDSLLEESGFEPLVPR